MSRLSFAVSNWVCKMVIRSECSLACISTTNCISSVYLLPSALFVANELLRSKFKTSNDVVNGLLNGEKERSSLLLRFCFFDGFSAVPLSSLLVAWVSKLLPPPIFDDDSSLISTSHKFCVVFCLWVWYKKKNRNIYNYGCGKYKVENVYKMNTS